MGMPGPLSRFPTHRLTSVYRDISSALVRDVLRVCGTLCLLNTPYLKTSSLRPLVKRTAMAKLDGDACMWTRAARHARDGDELPHACAAPWLHDALERLAYQGRLWGRCASHATGGYPKHLFLSSVFPKAHDPSCLEILRQRSNPGYPYLPPYLRCIPSPYSTPLHTQHASPRRNAEMAGSKLGGRFAGAHS